VRLQLRRRLQLLLRLLRLLLRLLRLLRLLLLLFFCSAVFCSMAEG
jgi:hypothetical protein